MTTPPQKPVLDAQRQHWEGTLGSKPELFGRDASEPARRSAEAFERAGVQRILELGGGQGRDSLFFAAEGFAVHSTTRSRGSTRSSARPRRPGSPLASPPRSTTRDGRCRSRTARSTPATRTCCSAWRSRPRSLGALGRAPAHASPRGLCVYTARNTTDPDFGRGVHPGEGLWENQGFIVHFFDRAKVELLARGWELVGVEEFDEGKLPRRLYRVTMRKPAARDPGATAPIP